MHLISVELINFSDANNKICNVMCDSILYATGEISGQFQTVGNTLLLSLFEYIS